ncbi:MAG: zinc ribbon domain-containing protein [Planctomycetota bacterium]|nr:MAG: zinc ribbon domain-containing protein [Planctomycetota bacterium]
MEWWTFQRVYEQVGERELWKRVGWWCILFFSFCTLGYGEGICPSCQKDFSSYSGYRFCPYDGKALKNICPRCQRMLDLEWRFCPYDGSEISRGGEKEKGALPLGSLKRVGSGKKSSSSKASVEIGAKKAEGKVVKRVREGAVSPRKLAPVALVKLFIRSLMSNNRQMAARLVDWDRFYESYVQEYKKRKREDFSAQEWERSKSDFRKKLLELLFSPRYVGILKKFPIRYLLKVTEKKEFFIYAWTKINGKKWQISFGLDRVGGEYRIIFIK